MIDHARGFHYHRTMSKLTTWLQTHFRVNDIVRDEYKFPCPRCQHPNFYFNIRKNLGWCHRATCHWAPTLEDLVKLVGVSPEEDTGFKVYTPVANPVGHQDETPLQLPKNAGPVIFTDPKHGTGTHCSKAVGALQSRGIKVDDMIKWDIRYNAIEDRIYVPIYEEGKLVNWVSRKVWGSPVDHPKEKRYLYAPGRSTTKYLLGWGEAKHWQRLTLVENTFNAIWLRDRLQCSTNFGSHLSKDQVAKIVKSQIKSVVLIWDEGADPRAEKAVRALHRQGVRAAFIQIHGQPDDHRIDFLEKWCDTAHELALNDKEYRLERRCKD